MLIYEKFVQGVRHLFGTINNVPSDSDNQLVYKDADGDTVSDISLNNKFFDNGSGGIIMVDSEGNETFLAVNINKGTPQSPDLVNVVPGGNYTPEEKVLVSIRFKHKPTKTVYAEGETIDTAGIKIEATFKSGEKEDVTSDCSFTPDSALETTDTEITASYTYGTVTKTATYSITVNAENGAPAEE